MPKAEDSEFGQEAIDQLNKIFFLVKGWRQRIEGDPLRPAAGSRLFEDDQILGGYELTHAVEGVLLSAVDHIDALRMLVQDAEAVHARAPFTLLRAALENAAIAVWLLAPEDRAERILRRLRLQWADANDQMSVQTLMSMTSGLTREEWKTSLRQAAADANLTEAQILRVTERPVSYRSIMEAAAEGATDLAVTGKHAVLCWMISSGIAHARTWAVLSILKRVESPGATDDVVTAKFSAPEKELTLVAQVTALMLCEAWELFDRHLQA